MPEPTDEQLDELLVAIGLTEQDDKPAPCGTQTAYRRHLQQGETPCQPCRDAHAAENRNRYANPSSGHLPPINHGTPGGARQHWYRKAPICQPCRDAYNAAQRAQYRASRRYLTETEWQERQDTR